jgi:Tfp pilus assembly protein PilO
MKKYFSNLRPFERRVVVAVAVTVFIVFNAWFVFPHFSDWTKVQTRMKDAQWQLAKYQTEINQAPVYKKLIEELVGPENQDVPAEDQASQFQRVIQMHQAQSGVNVTSTSRINTSTNQFFLELSQNIGVQSTEQQLVNFLFDLGSGTSLIRVRDISLHTDPPRQQLIANVKLVASYQKAALKGAAPAARRAAAAATAAKPGDITAQ